MSYFREFMTNEMIKTVGSEIGEFLRSMQDDGEKKEKSREKILRLLKGNPKMTTKQLSESIGISAKAIEKHLARLKSEGLLIREGSDKGGRWTVLD